MATNFSFSLTNSICVLIFATENVVHLEPVASTRFSDECLFSVTLDFERDDANS